MGSNTIIAIVVGAIMVIVGFSLWPVLNGASNSLYAYFRNSCDDGHGNRFLRIYAEDSAAENLPANPNSATYYSQARKHGGSGAAITGGGTTPPQSTTQTINSATPSAYVGSHVDYTLSPAIEGYSTSVNTATPGTGDGSTSMDIVVLVDANLASSDSLWLYSSSDAHPARLDDGVTVTLSYTRSGSTNTYTFDNSHFDDSRFSGHYTGFISGGGTMPSVASKSPWTPITFTITRAGTTGSGSACAATDSAFAAAGVFYNEQGDPLGTYVPASNTVMLSEPYRFVEVAPMLQRFAGINNLLLTILPVVSIAGFLGISGAKLYSYGRGTASIGSSISTSVFTLIGIVVAMVIAGPILGSAVDANQVVVSGQYQVNGTFGNIIQLLFAMIPVVYIAGLVTLVGLQARTALMGSSGQ